MVVYNFKTIAPVPTHKDFVDIVLTRTQRKTPTVVHSSWQISRIRSFYMRKIKFTQTTYHEKLSAIVDEFPKLDDIHPFYADLINVLYDRDHYKLALGQINTARQIIDNIAKDYLRLLKFGDSLFRCKQLKRAGMGRMCTVMRKQGPTLAYLEEVRKHLARLPAIDPSTRTLLVCGYPNVGKSSFMNKVTRAEVDVQPYAFTTKSLFVGHMDYKYTRWQVIDTPGILDHPLEERNTIEMQSITALAHLQCTVLYFLDISGQCGYTIDQQVGLFNNISPLFANKPLMVVATKIDAQPWETLPEEDKAKIQAVCASSGASFRTMSNFTDAGVAEVKAAGCESLLERRIETKMKASKKVSEVLNRLAVVLPKPRDGKERTVTIPTSVVQAKVAAAAATAAAGDDEDDEEMGGTGGTGASSAGPHPMVKKWLERDKERAGGGPGVYKADTTKYYLLRDDEWKSDIIPEVINGKNITDYVDADILERLMALEAEEEALTAAYDASKAADDESEEDEETAALYEAIKAKKAEAVMSHRLGKAQNRPGLPRNKLHRTAEQVVSGLKEAGYDSDTAEGAASAAQKAVERGRKRTRDDVRTGAGASAHAGDADAMEEDGAAGAGVKRARSSSAALRKQVLVAKYGSEAKARSVSRARSREPSIAPPQAVGMPNEEVRQKAIKAFGKFRSKKFEGKQGESDRRIPNERPKWMLSGKRGIGKTDRR